MTDEKPSIGEYTAWERMNHMLLLQSITLILVALTLLVTVLR
jgi:hypothetical protein